MKALLTLAVGTALAGLGAPAHAQQVIDDFGTYGRSTPTESSQDMAVELRFGKYIPDIDGEFDVAKPYERVFGTKSRYAIGFEVDWQAMRIPYLGTFGPGLGAMYTKYAGRGYLQRDLTIRAEEESTLTLIPINLVGVLRIDSMSRNSRIPLVPYVKAGLGAAIWWVGDGDGTAETDSGSVGRGISYGPEFALGGMFLLDALEPDAAIELDSTMGINNSYFFMEWFVSRLDGFGSGKQMQVGTNTWMLGLAMEI